MVNVCIVSIAFTITCLILTLLAVVLFVKAKLHHRQYNKAALYASRQENREELYSKYFYAGRFEKLVFSSPFTWTYNQTFKGLEDEP